MNNIVRSSAIIAVFVILVAWALATHFGRKAEADLLTDSAARISSLAKIHADQAALLVAAADGELQRLRDVAVREGAAGFAREALSVSRPDVSGVDRVAYISSSGQLLSSFVQGKSTPLTANVSDRDYFQVFRDNPEDRLFITEPLIGKTSGRWILLFVRPVIRGGKFDGVVFVGVEAGYFSRLFQPQERPGLMLSLISGTGRIIAHSKEPDTAIGMDVSAEIARLRGSAVADILCPLDGILRLSTMYPVHDAGLTVVAGIERRVLEDDIAAQWRVLQIPAMALTLLLMAGLVLLHRSTQKERLAMLAQRSEMERSRTILRSMREGVLLLDADGSIVFCNGSADRWMGEPQGKALDVALADAGLMLVTEEGLPFAAADPVRSLCLEGGQAIEDAWLVERGDNQRCWLQLRAHPLLDDKGVVTAAIVTLDDRSDEHERLTEAELARTILSRMHDAVLVTDSAGQAIMVNSAFLLQSGYREDEIIGRNPRVLSSGRHDADFWKSFWTTITRDGRWTGKVWNRRKDGTEYCVSHTITAVRDLRGSVVRYVAVTRDITAQEAQEKELWQRANFDSLTGLSNRARFDDRLAQVLHQAARHPQIIAICYIDLDRFKPVNDTLGHQAGDELLRQVAQRMRTIIRKDDLLSRIGGDEFALLMPRLKAEEDALLVAGKLLAALKQPFTLSEATVEIGASVGIAVYPRNGRESADLVEAADLALYRAKADGRGCIRVAEGEAAMP